MPSKRSNVWIVSLSILVAITFGGIHLASISVTEVTKDTFEAFSLDASLIPIVLQHRLMFSLLGWVLALSGGYLARDYFYAQGGAGIPQTTFADLRLWIVFLGALTISGSVFYYSFIAC